MARKNTFIEGDTELLAAIEKMGTEIAEDLAKAANLGAAIIEDSANAKAGSNVVAKETRSADYTRIVIAIGLIKDKWYYRFMEFGAQPHIIESVDARALRFPGAGGAAYAKGARPHPGIIARPFLRPALEVEGNRAAEAVINYLWSQLATIKF